MVSLVGRQSCRSSRAAAIVAFSAFVALSFLISDASGYYVRLDRPEYLFELRGTRRKSDRNCEPDPALHEGPPIPSNSIYWYIHQC
jgi:hypothetical protein